MSGHCLSPTVLWAQRKHFVLLRVQVKSLEKPDFSIYGTHMEFKVFGEGLSGKATYSFQLVFCEPVNTEHCRVKIAENEIEFRIVKKEVANWPRLQCSLERPHWLKLDFNHWVDLSDEEVERMEDEKEGEQETRAEKMKNAPKLLAEKEKKRAQMLAEVKRLQKEASGFRQTVNSAKKAYLLIYNGIQWAGFILIVMTLLKSLTKGLDGIQSAYTTVTPMLMFSQCLMMLEIVHSAFGLVKSGIMTVFLQVFGRFLILFFVLFPSEEIHEHPIVFVLYLVWSLIELFRYPYYALSVLDMEWNMLTWLRYTAWIPLYPLGFTCEATVLWLSIPHFVESGDFHLSLPNPFNISFYPPAVLAIGLLNVPLIAYTEMTHMYSLRKKKLAKLKKE